MNPKGGTNNNELKKLFKNSWLHLYPDIADKPGKILLAKLDSGPGQKDLEFLAWRRLLSFITHPGCPNTTSVTQERGSNYGEFKRIVRYNLENIAMDRYAKKISLNMGPHLVGILVYGGVDPVSGVELGNAFESAFVTNANLHAWGLIGAAPLTRACLKEPQVFHDGTDSEDTEYDMYQSIQATNKRDTEALLFYGYKGDLLQVTLEKDFHRCKNSVTVANTQARQESISYSKTHVQIFLATGGQHINAGNMFKGSDINNKNRRIEELEKDKEARQEFDKLQQADISILHQQKPTENLFDKDLEILLCYEGVQKSKQVNKPDKMIKWKNIIDNEGKMSSCSRWTDADKVQLQSFKEAYIEMGDTDFGRFVDRKKKEASAVYGKMSVEERYSLNLSQRDIDEQEQMQEYLQDEDG